jgi:hypothetical protein
MCSLLSRLRLCTPELATFNLQLTTDNEQRDLFGCGFAALRYLLLFEAMLRSGQLTYGEIRDRESGRLQTLTYAAWLWQLFRALIEGALNNLVRDLGRKIVRRVLDAIDQTVEGFLNDALHLSPEQASVQLKAEQLGYLWPFVASNYRQNVS